LADTWRNFSAALAFKASNTEIVWFFLLRNGGELNDSTLQALRPALDDNKLVESKIERVTGKGINELFPRPAAPQKNILYDKSKNSECKA